MVVGVNAVNTARTVVSFPVNNLSDLSSKLYYAFEFKSTSGLEQFLFGIYPTFFNVLRSVDGQSASGTKRDFKLYAR